MNDKPQLTAADIEVILLKNNKILGDEIMHSVDSRIKPFSEQAIQLATNDGVQQAKLDQLTVRLITVGTACGTVGGFVGFIAAGIFK